MIDVTAVMITGKPGRKPLALTMVQSFLNQTYDKSKLMIINDGEQLNIDYSRIIEINPRQSLTLGGAKKFFT